MAIRTVANQYVGINARLHSYFQSEGGRDSFHANHLTFLTAALKAELLPMGYTAEVQQSLQIRRFGEPAGKPESDVTIYDSDPTRSRRLVKRGDIRELPISEVMSIDPELSQYGAVAICEFAPGQSDRGELVA